MADANLGYQLLVEKHTKAANALLKYVSQCKYTKLDFKDCKKIWLQLRSNVLLNEIWVGPYKQVDTWMREAYPVIVAKDSDLKEAQKTLDHVNGTR